MATTGFNSAYAWGTGISALGSALVGAISARNQMSLQKMSFEAQARIDEINAQAAELAAQSIIMSGKREAQRFGQQFAQLRGKQVAAVGASGLDFSSESVKRLMQGDQELYANDLAQIETNAINQAFGYKNQAANQRLQGYANSATAGVINPSVAMASGLAAGIGGVASAWYRYAEFNGGGATPYSAQPLVDSPAGWYESAYSTQPLVTPTLGF